MSTLKKSQRSIGQIILCATLLLTLLLTSRSLSAQSTTPDALVFFDALPFAGPGWETSGEIEGRIDLYAVIPYNQLSFRRSEGEFTARYRMQLQVENETGVLFDSLWDREVRTRVVERTNGTEKAFDFYQHRQLLPAGTYTARLTMTEVGTSNSVEEIRNVTVIPFPRYRFSLSGLMLVGKIRESKGEHSISPLLTDNVSRNQDGYFLFFESYVRRDLDSVELIALYRNRDGEEVWRDTTHRSVESDELVRRIQSWVQLPNEPFPKGEYTVDLIASRIDREDDTLALARRKVRIEGVDDGMPMTEEEMRERVDVLRYVASQNEINYLNWAVTYSDLRDRYREFWVALDPTPGTAKNEAMEEYFRRVDYANKKFRSYTEGWLTDMGRIYIVYGDPDRISRDPFATDGKTRVTWTYFRRGGDILFIDQTGFDDFRLVTPVPMSEKFRY